MTTLIIKPVDPNDEVLPYGVIKFHCKKCKRTTKHDRKVFDRFSLRWRKPKAKKFIRTAIDGGGRCDYECRKCGIVTKF